MTQRNPFSLPYLEPDSRTEWDSSLLSSSRHPGECGPGVSLGEKKQSLLNSHLPKSALARTEMGDKNIDKVGIPQIKVASHCAVPSLGPSLGGTGSTLSSLDALLVVSVCLKEVCPTQMWKI